MQGASMIDSKAPDAFRTISEAADDLALPQHVLRFWETRFPQIKPLKRGGGRRYYRPDDLEFLRGLKHLLHEQRYTIKGVQKIIKDHGVKSVQRAVKGEIVAAAPVSPGPVNAKASAAPASPVRNAPMQGDTQSRLQAALEELLACRRIIAQLQTN
jgi:DNA-binding transcriptional MerR regulator